jgi:hypothetical protein
MPLSPEQEWTLVACGLVAHADGIVGDAEWGQVLYLLGERLDDHEAGPWIELLRDRDALHERLASLAPPPPFLSEGILEKAWRLALSDGVGSGREAEVHDEVAARLGVEASEARRMRNAWTDRAARRAEVVAGFAAIVTAFDGQVAADERAQYEALLQRLPLTAQRRAALVGQLEDPPDTDDIVGRLSAIDPEDRHIVVLELAPLVRASASGAQQREMFFDLAERLGITRDDAEHILAR